MSSLRLHDKAREFIPCVRLKIFFKTLIVINLFADIFSSKRKPNDSKII